LDDVTEELLSTPDYLVVQRGGQGNALGKVIFRFDNKFSVFMHDTSNPGVFQRSNRSVSHGCIRAEKPMELAFFMLGDNDTKNQERIRYTMKFHSTTNGNRGGGNGNDDSLPYDKRKYLNNLVLPVAVPIFITYYTMYPDTADIIRKYKDVYGYDKVIYEYLRGYI